MSEINFNIKRDYTNKYVLSFWDGYSWCEERIINEHEIFNWLESNNEKVSLLYELLQSGHSLYINGQDLKKIT
jgi:hypothetical protein